MQKSLGPKSAAPHRALRVLSGNKARRTPGSVLSKRPPPPAAAQQPESVRSKPPPPDAAHPPEPVRSKPLPPAESSAAADAALDRLLFTRSDLAGIVSQIDELISDALQCQTISTRGKQEIESLSLFLSNTNASLKQWSSRLKQVFETCPSKNDAVSKQTPGMSSNPAAGPVATPSCNLLNGRKSNLPDDDSDMIVSPSPLVSWRTGACMVESGKQLFLLTPLPKGCSSRCPTSKTQKTASSMDQLDTPSLPVWKLTIADDDHPDPQQVVKVKEGRPGTATPNVTTSNKGTLEDRSPHTLSIQKNMRSLPRSCLKTALSKKQQLFSPIPECSWKEDFLSDGTTLGDKCSKACDDISSSDEISKDLASRYDLYGMNQFSKNTPRGRQTDDTLQWFLSPLKTCVLMNPSDDDKTIPTPATINIRGQQDVPDGKPVQTPAQHSNALLATPWKGLESTNLKGRRAGETTLKRELWKRFEAVSTNELHFDKALFQKLERKCFLDMLEEAT